jgi:hypothetical protein
MLRALKTKEHVVFPGRLMLGLWKLRNMCFEGGSWSGMKLVWRMVLPMKDLAGFEDALNVLEKKVWRPERVTLNQTWLPRTEGGEIMMLAGGVTRFDPP